MYPGPFKDAKMKGKINRFLMKSDGFVDTFKILSHNGRDHRLQYQSSSSKISQDFKDKIAIIIINCKTF